MSQTTFSAAPLLAINGMLATSLESKVLSKVAAGSVRVGHLAPFTAPSGLNPGTVLEMPAVAVDVDSIIATLGISGITALDYVTTALNGVVGATEMVPARKLSATFNSHADWDATTMTIQGFDADGQGCVATITIPNGGNATVTQNENVYFSRVTKVSIPIQTGANGTFTVGFIADDAMYPRGGLLLPLYDASREPYNSSNQYVDEDPVPCLQMGEAWATIAAGTAGQQLYVRVVEITDHYRGELRGGPATGFAPVLGGRLLEVSNTTLGRIELK